MHRLFYVFGGVITDFVHFVTKNKKKTEFNRDMRTITDSIQNDGLFIQNNFLNQYEISELNNIILDYSFKLRKTDREIKDSNYKQKYQKFDSKNPSAILYEMDENYLINQKIIQKIMLKDEIFEIGKEYFGCEPCFDHISLGITSDFNKDQNPDSQAAQLYHFDLDRPRWLKFLIYVNDVDFDNGPHCFIKKSHKKNTIPFSIRSRGYTRIADTDEKMKQLIKNNELILTGSAGTAIIEDTKGLHKGAVVKRGHRVLLNLQINSSMFGTAYKKVNFNNIDKDLLERFREKKDFFSQSTNLISFLNK